MNKDYIAGLKEASEIIERMVATGQWEGQFSAGFLATVFQEIDLAIIEEEDKDE